MLNKNLINTNFIFMSLFFKNSDLESLVMNVFFRLGLHIYSLSHIQYQRFFQNESPLGDLENIFVLYSWQTIQLIKNN